METEARPGTTIPLYALYGQIDAAAELRFLHLESLYARNQLYGWNIRPHRHHDLHQMIWVADGHGTVVLDDRTLALHSPVLLSIPPTMVHGFQWVPGAEGLVLTLAESFVADILKLSEDPAIETSLGHLLAITGALHARSLTRLHDLFASTVDEYVHERVGRITAIAGNVTLLFAELARLRHFSVQPEDDPQARSIRAVCRDFRRLVESHFREHWSVARYASVLAMAERSLRRACVQELGLSPQQVIHRRLFIEARRDLLYTDKTVAEVGYGLGFEDPAYFTRFFVRHEKDTPQVFRRQRTA
ncbi:MAG TPA: helix-turn-helix domain-containing protein [Castellaniella sp.]|uniref:helix-turn-helix domain-containing protein n=1 Tax=Castellaniella sp. TaxID=1955812 RepID=UPI002F138E4C